MSDENVTYDEGQEWDDQAIYGPSTVIAAFDRIEELVEQARVVPLSAMVMVNKAEIMDLLEQAREALPEDLAAADAVVADADAVLGRADSAAEVTIAEANTRARSTLEEARDKARQLVTDAEERIDRMLGSAQDDAEEMVSSAQREAASIVKAAQEEAQRLVSEQNIMQMAEEQARQIMAEARHQDTQLRRGADEYAAKSLSELSALLHDLHRRTEAGRRAIDERSGVNRTDIAIDE